MRTHHTTTTRRITTVRNPFHRDLSYSLGTGVGGDRPAATETETWRSEKHTICGEQNPGSGLTWSCAATFKRKEGLGTVVRGVITRNARLQLERIVLHSKDYCLSISLIVPNYVDEPSWKHTLIKWRFNIALPPTGIVGALDGTALDDLIWKLPTGRASHFLSESDCFRVGFPKYSEWKGKKIENIAVNKNFKNMRDIWSHLIGLAPSYPCHIRYGIQVQKDLRTRYLVLRNSLSNSLKHLDRSG